MMNFICQLNEFTPSLKSKIENWLLSIVYFTHAF